jgi:hypothetical protein
LSRVTTTATRWRLKVPADRHEVPRFLRIALYAMLLVAGALSVPLIGRFGPLPTTGLLDVWIGLFIVVCVVRGRTQQWGLLLLLLGYALTRVIPAIYIGAPVEDFLQAYRWVLYLIAFTLAVGRMWGPVRPLVNVTVLLIAMALVKSILTFVVARDGARPGLLLENNFELALFCGLAVVMYRHLGRGKPWTVAGLGLLTVLSGSRSGAFAFIVLALYAITQIPRSRANLFQRFLMLCLTPLLVLIPVTIFASRTGTLRIDRLNFLDVFLYETRNWDILNWIFGTVPITPFTEGCRTLSYYQSLFASTNDGMCYSVILHAFLMRVIFDAGIVGALIAFGVMWFALRKAGTTVLLTLALVAIAITNSISVSGPNNPYVALPVLLGIMVANLSPKPPQSKATQAKSNYRRLHSEEDYRTPNLRGRPLR